MDVRILQLMCVVTTLFFCGCAAKRDDTMTQPRALKIQPTRQVVKPVEREIDLGRSVEDREIVVRVLGYSEDITLIMGAIHGNEPTSAVVAERLLEHLRSHPEQLEGRSVAILTAANPDGLARRLRPNKRLVDLNRNFPANNWAKTRRGVYFGGAAAASEPETLALMKLFEEIK